MAVSASLLAFGNTTANQSAYSTASVSPAADRVLLLGVNYAITNQANPPQPSSISGLGLTWNHITTILGGGTTSRAISLYRAQTGGSPPTPGTVTMNFAGTQDAAGWAVIECSGAALGNNGASAAGTVDTLATPGSTVNLSLGAGSDGSVTLVFANENTGTPYTGTGVELNGSTVNTPTVQWTVRYSSTGISSWSITTGNSTQKAAIGIRVLPASEAAGGYTLAEWDGNQLVPLTVAEWDGSQIVELDIERHS